MSDTTIININSIPSDVLFALRRRNSDEKIVRMTPKEMFAEYCTWHGLVGWGEHLYDLTKSLNSL